MLSDSERQTPREMQRRLSTEDPDLVRCFHSAGPNQLVVRRRRARPSLIVQAEMVIALAVVGPNILTEARIATLMAPPAPRRRTK